jgi:flagellar basal-body rod protein FlgB
MKVFDGTMARLERALDVRLVRQNVLASNLANVDTPGFKPRDVDFTASMVSIEGAARDNRGVALPNAPTLAPAGSGDAAGFSANELPIVESQAGGGSFDGNTVDLDRTMVAMAENALQYQASARAISKKIGILRYVASDGNG